MKHSLKDYLPEKEAEGVTITVRRIPDEVHQRLVELAKEYDVSLNTLVLAALESAVNEE